MAKKKAVEQKDPVVGATVVAVRPLTAQEAERFGWSLRRHEAAVAVVLSTGAVLVPSQDYEGNGPGALFGFDADGDFVLNPGQG